MKPLYWGVFVSDQPQVCGEKTASGRSLWSSGFIPLSKLRNKLTIILSKLKLICLFILTKRYGRSNFRLVAYILPKLQMYTGLHFFKVYGFLAKNFRSVALNCFIFESISKVSVSFLVTNHVYLCSMKSVARC